MLSHFVLYLFPFVMIYAAFSDLFTMIIANWLSLLLIVSYLVLSLLLGISVNGILYGLSCGLTVLLITFFLFTRGLIGGGDAKLAAATSIWLGWGNLLDYFLVGTIIGGELAVIFLFLRQFPLPQFLIRENWIVRLHDKKTGLPYGIALAAAGLFVYPSSELYLLVYGG